MKFKTMCWCWSMGGRAPTCRQRRGQMAGGPTLRAAAATKTKRWHRGHLQPIHTTFLSLECSLSAAASSAASLFRRSRSFVAGELLAAHLDRSTDSQNHGEDIGALEPNCAAFLPAVAGITASHLAPYCRVHASLLFATPVHAGLLLLGAPSCAHNVHDCGSGRLGSGLPSIVQLPLLPAADGIPRWRLLPCKWPVLLPAAGAAGCVRAGGAQQRRWAGRCSGAGRRRRLPGGRAAG